MSSDDILANLCEALRSDRRVHAAWLEGSRAEGLSDQYSDYDFWLDVDDGTEDGVLLLIEEVLGSAGALDLRFEMPVRHPKLRHVTYHVANTDPFHRFEVNIQAHSRAFRFVEALHTIKVLFDKDGTIAHDHNYSTPNLSERRQFLAEKFDVGILWVDRELNRGDYLSAYYAYELWLLRPLVELARIKYAPNKIEFGLKHATRDLPESLTRRLEGLYKNFALEDIRQNVARAIELREEL